MALILAVVLLFFLPLLGSLRSVRLAPVDFFWRSLFPAAGAHLLCLVVLSLRFRGKALPALAFWGASFIAFLALGQLRLVVAFVLVGLAALLFVAVGEQISRVILPVSSWAINLGFGILVSSVVGSLLAWFHVFHGWSAALTLVPLAMLTLRRRWREWPAGSEAVLSRLRAPFRKWTLERALALEGVFLLFLFVLVDASAPQTRSDAIRVYWPYVKLLDHFGGFIQMPFHWSYIIPQPGVTFSATMLACFGTVAVRFSMFLVLISMVGICVGGSLIGRPAATVLAIVVGSCPIVLLTASSLMQDAFVSVVVLLLAVVCTEGKSPGSAGYWTAVGGLVGLAWCAKYSAVCYVVPLGIWAVVRGRPVGWSKNLQRCLGLGGGSALLVAAPWLAHSYTQSGNPVFPFLRRVFPSSLWPEDLAAFASEVLRQFSLRPGIRGVLMAPLDLTFHTNRFVEGPAGFLGIAFPILLVLALVAAVRGSSRSRVLIVAGIVGTALVWRSTAYVRYWLPGLWLVGAGVATETKNIFPGRKTGILAVSIGILFAVLQVPFFMVEAWGHSDGWPWKLYRGTMSEQEFLEHTPGFRALRKMEAGPPAWPRFWYTGFESVGNVRGIPIMAELWELRLHGATDLESITRYIERAKCDYWVVKTDGPGTHWLEDLGVGSRFWTSENLFASEGAVKVYRLPPPLADRSVRPGAVGP
ncbi:MAG: glycosyltransferase family 39 protein [Thermoanaerobaculia bacterium]